MPEGAAEEIRQFIQQQGRITFARFMETALFSPRGGYYTSVTHGAGRDFFTAPAAHPIFGALIAQQLEQLWRLMGTPSPFHVVEVGAGRGTLARDILAHAPGLSPGFAGAMRYAGLDYDPSWSREGGGQAVRALGLPVREVEGCILSNELLDSLPVHRFVIREGRVMEAYVTLEGGELAEVLGEPSTPGIGARLAGLELTEGFRGEVNLAMEGWTEEVGRALKRGFVLTVDYGHPAVDLYAAERSRGTLRCYYQHTLNANPYVNIGRQDITAHVDFTSLIQFGESNGLATVGFSTQREFLYNLGFGRHLASLGTRQLSQGERDANRMAMLELVRPGGMGDFKVLAQAKGLDEGVQLLGFAPDSPLRQGGGTGGALPQGPLLSGEHMDLMAARYPHLSWGWEALWPFGKQE